MTRRRELALVVLLCLAGLGLRWAMTAHWCFAGSDSYGYLEISDEVRHHGRFALAEKAPLEWARLPLYPLFLTLKGDASVDRSWGGDPSRGGGWLRITRAQALVDLLGIALLVWALVRRLAGPRAALGTLAFAVFSPFTTPYVGAVLTETLAVALSTLALAPLFLWSGRRAFALSGALIGLGMLLRADAILLWAALVPAAWFLGGSWRERIVCGALAIAVGLGVFAPWPIRNLVQFGALHPIGARIDRASRPLTNVDGYWRWLRSFARSWEPTTSPWSCYYDLTLGCQSVVPDLEQENAFATPAEEARVITLLTRRARLGLSAEIDGEFARLADERAAARPLYVTVVLPLLRAGNMWVSWYVEPFGAPSWRPLKPVSDWLADFMLPLTLLQLCLFVGAAAYLVSRRERRGFAVIAGTMMLARTAVLAWTGYCMPRYALEMMPLGWVMVAVAASDLVARRRATS